MLIAFPELVLNKSRVCGVCVVVAVVASDSWMFSSVSLASSLLIYTILKGVACSLLKD